MAAPLLTASETHYPANVITNLQSIQYVKSTTSSISGAAAGILGLTNTSGFLFYLVSSLLVGLAFALGRCRASPSQFFVGKGREVVLGGLLDNAFGFVLFWTLFYALVHIYD